MESETEEIEYEEPLLKYSPLFTIPNFNLLGSQTSCKVTSLLLDSKVESKNVEDEDSITCIRATNRFVAVGTNHGFIFMLDTEGNVIKKSKIHRFAVNDIQVDSTSEFIASASNDSNVIISSLYASSDKDSSIFSFQTKVLVVALEPDFGKKTSRQFVIGGENGHVILSAKGWFGNSKVALDSGQNGPVTAITWQETFIVWANSKNVLVYDTASSSLLGRLENGAQNCRCNIEWINSLDFMVGWGDRVQVAGIRARTAMDIASGLGNKQIEILHQFQTEFMVSGIASLDSTVVLLGFETAAIASDQKAPQPPEIHVVTISGIEIANDILTMPGYELFSAMNYRLSKVSLDSLSPEEPQMPFQESVYYISSARDIVMAKTRDVRDHVQWLTQAGRFIPALQLVQAEPSLKQYTIREREQEILKIGLLLIQQLLGQNEFRKAGEWAVQVLGTNVEAWDNLVVSFANAKQLSEIRHHVPTENPILSRNTYDVLLVDLLETDLSLFHETINAWPPSIYSLKSFISAVEGKLNGPADMILHEILVDLNEKDHNNERAVFHGMVARKPGQGDRLISENMFSFLHDNVRLILEYALFETIRVYTECSVIEVMRHCSKSQILTFLGESLDYAPITHCMECLKGNPKLQHIYLDSLFLTRDADLEHSFKNEQVLLFAEYDPERLLSYLRKATGFSFPEAFKICEERDLVQEMMYLLGKMGDNRKALYLIIERVGDVDMAIEFAKDQNDASLWDEFLTYAMDKPKFILGLLKSTTGFLDPLRIIEKIPENLEILELRPAIIQIMSDCRVQLSLREGCEKILQSDIWATFEEMNRAQQNGRTYKPETRCSHCDEAINDPKDHVILFFCSHSFHAACIKANIALVEQTAGEQTRNTLMILDRAVDFVYNRSVALEKNRGLPESTWVDTRAIACPICSS